MAGRVEGLDVASGGELALVLEAGGAGDRISFAGPGKTERELEAALTAGVTVNLESDGEFSRLLALGERAGRRPRVAVRWNPDFGLKASGIQLGGGANTLGLDVPAWPVLQ